MEEQVINVGNMTDEEIKALDEKFEKVTRDMVFTGTGYGLKREFDDEDCEFDDGEE